MSLQPIPSQENQLLFRQLFENQTSTYTYLLADEKSREAILIDPVFETVDRDAQLIKNLNLNLKWTLETHVHADHITGASALREKLGSQIAISAESKVTGADRLLHDSEEIHFGAFSIKALATPGHTNSCMSYLCRHLLFTGDSLLIGVAGRTDFQEGSSQKLYNSIQKKLFSLPADTQVYPGHDYRGFTVSTIGYEKKFNARINLETSEESFIKTMSSLNLPPPKKINEAVPANLVCGKYTKPTHSAV